jgi:hypothetical protein
MRWITLALVFVTACADKAKPEYARCIQMEAAGNLQAAWDSCNSAVGLDATSESGKEAASKLSSIKVGLAKQHAAAEAREKAALEEKARVEAETRVRELARIRPLLISAEPILRSCLALWRRADAKHKCQKDSLYRNYGNVWPMLAECGDFQEINETENRIRSTLKQITDQIGDRPEAKNLADRLEAACEQGEYEEPLPPAAPVPVQTNEKQAEEPASSVAILPTLARAEEARLEPKSPAEPLAPNQLEVHGERNTAEKDDSCRIQNALEAHTAIGVLTGFSLNWGDSREHADKVCPGRFVPAQRPDCASDFLDVQQGITISNWLPDETAHLSFFGEQGLFDLYMTTRAPVESVVNTLSRVWEPSEPGRWDLADTVIVTVKTIKNGRTAIHAHKMTIDERYRELYSKSCSR